MKNIYDLTFEELENYFISIDDKKFRAVQIFDWLYKKRVKTYDDMFNIKNNIKDNLKDNFSFEKISIIDKKIGKDVCKFLFKLKDNNVVEAVLMNHDYGNSLCVSTQVGCNMGCTFCESGRRKKVRNLEVHEMTEQILLIEEEMNIRISHIVLMGIGEPFDNYDNVIKFIKIINCGKGIDIGARHITVSTSGIIPKIEEFMELDIQVNLAISLHAPNDELRSKLMPINNAYSLKKLISVLKRYIEKTNRRLTLEYILLKDVNDTEKCAHELKKSNQDAIMNFFDILKKGKINVTIRREFGSEVMAACGQLRSNYEEEL